MNAILQRFTRARAVANRRLTGEETLTVQLLVEAGDTLRVRRAIVSMLQSDIDILSVAPVPRDTRVRLTIRFKRGAREQLLAALMKTVESGEFGMIRPLLRSVSHAGGARSAALS